MNMSSLFIDKNITAVCMQCRKVPVRLLKGGLFVLERRKNEKIYFITNVN